MRFLVYGIAVWRLAYLLVREDGPGRIFRDLREATGVEHDEHGDIIGWNDITPLHCIYCTSMWAAPLVAILPAPLTWFLAGSGAAILIDKLTSLKPVRIVNNSG